MALALLETRALGCSLIFSSSNSSFHYHLLSHPDPRPPDPDSPPLLECALSCDNLLCDSLGRPPSTRLLLAVRSGGPGGRWRPYAGTEVVERTSNPGFMVTVTFRAEHGIGPATQVWLGKDTKGTNKTCAGQTKISHLCAGADHGAGPQGAADDDAHNSRLGHRLRRGAAGSRSGPTNQTKDKQIK